MGATSWRRNKRQRIKILQFLGKPQGPYTVVLVHKKDEKGSVENYIMKVFERCIRKELQVTLVNNSLILGSMVLQTQNHVPHKWYMIYLYYCANETFKILKFRSSIAVHNLYKFSTRGQKNIFIIYVKSIIKIDDPATSVFILKLKIKTYLLNKQILGNAENWVENKFIQL